MKRLPVWLVLALLAVPWLVLHAWDRRKRKNP